LSRSDSDDVEEAGFDANLPNGWTFRDRGV
jgi:hypothetical protein